MKLLEYNRDILKKIYEKADSGQLVYRKALAGQELLSEWLEKFRKALEAEEAQPYFIDSVCSDIDPVLDYYELEQYSGNDITINILYYVFMDDRISHHQLVESTLDGSDDTIDLHHLKAFLVKLRFIVERHQPTFDQLSVFISQRFFRIDELLEKLENQLEKDITPTPGVEGTLQLNESNPPKVIKQRPDLKDHKEIPGELTKEIIPKLFKDDESKNKIITFLNENGFSDKTIPNKKGGDFIRNIVAFEESKIVYELTPTELKKSLDETFKGVPCRQGVGGHLKKYRKANTSDPRLATNSYAPQKEAILKKYKAFKFSN